jgi:hypothetical protein
MRRFAPALFLLPALLATVPAHAQSPAQRQAQQQVARDQRSDRVADAERDLATGGTAGSSAVVDDLNGQRPTLSPERVDNRPTSPRAPAETTIPLLSDNPQR